MGYPISVQGRLPGHRQLFIPLERFRQPFKVTGSDRHVAALDKDEVIIQIRKCVPVGPHAPLVFRADNDVVGKLTQSFVEHGIERLDTVVPDDQFVFTRRVFPDVIQRPECAILPGGENDYSKRLVFKIDLIQFPFLSNAQTILPPLLPSALRNLSPMSSPKFTSEPRVKAWTCSPLNGMDLSASSFGTAIISRPPCRITRFHSFTVDTRSTQCSKICRAMTVSCDSFSNGSLFSTSATTSASDRAFKNGIVFPFSTQSTPTAFGIVLLFAQPKSRTFSPDTRPLTIFPSWSSPLPLGGDSNPAIHSNHLLNPC